MAPAGPGSAVATVVAICLAALGGSGWSAIRSSGSALLEEPQLSPAALVRSFRAEAEKEAEEVSAEDEAELERASSAMEQGELAHFANLRTMLGKLGLTGIACWSSAGLFAFGVAIDCALAVAVGRFLRQRRRRSESGATICNGESAKKGAICVAQTTVFDSSPRRAFFSEELDPKVLCRGPWQGTPPKSSDFPLPASQPMTPPRVEANLSPNNLEAKQLTHEVLELRPDALEEVAGEKLTEDFLKRLESMTSVSPRCEAEDVVHWGSRGGAASSRASASVKGSPPPREKGASAAGSPCPRAPPLTPKEKLPELPTPGSRPRRQLLEELWLVDLLRDPADCPGPHSRELL